jgi:hypothetical protein
MGWQIAIGLASKGLDIAVADVREDWGKESADAIRAETGRRAISSRLTFPAAPASRR